MEFVHVEHTFAPVFDARSKVLILGSFPSVKSREQSFYYGHPQNRFWKVLAACVGESVPTSIDEKKDLLYRHGIALWDVVQSCTIVGSSDSAIRDVVPQDLSSVLQDSSIQVVFLNGNKAFELFKKYDSASCTLPFVKLPSTSPANAAYSLSRLVEVWKREMDVVL